MTASTESAIRPGWISLHGHRLEWLRDAVLGWMAAHPLPGLEPEVLVVPSNGMAEWFKRSMAQQLGLCAALRVELPSHFLWRCYRAVLGAEAVPRRAALDKPLLVWRLMRLLRDEPERVPVMTADALSRWHLCRQLADLYDQYQIYRPDWLAAWADGQDVLSIAPGRNEPQLLAPDQRWQAQLWRRLLEQLDGDELAALRPEVHQRFVEVLAQPELLADASTLSLPRRVIVFGPSHLPQQQLEALEALSGQVQILLAIPNPCRFHWADLIDGREWLAQVRRRQPLRSGRDPAALSLADAHAEAHPLLVAWGRQGRDFLRLLDAAEDRATAAGREALPRIDLFGVDSVDGADTGPDGSGTPGTLLTQIQEAIRDLRPLSEHPRALGQSQPVDDSVVFQIAHSPLREFEILQDHLLDQLARPGRGGQKLRPRDIIVMVPDIEPCAALIDAVFGAVPRGDARYIPYEIADLGPGRRDPVVVALDWLLGMPQRCTVTELGDLLDVGALARRFGLRPEQRPVLDRWIREAGVRWGLSEPQRADLGLEVCGEINSWVFGLRRMLLGYACGAAPAWRGIEPHDEVAGLEAVAAGGLAELLHALLGWRDQAVAPAALSVWIDRGRALLAQFFVASDEAERLVLVALEQALGRLADESLPAALPSGDDELLPLTVFRAAWLDRLGELDAGRRFIGGGVTFCTLMPMRAIPFDLVCLLGMNEADYPRRAAAADFDLMRLPGQRRPGDRARRDDDRALMLEALLSARQQLLISWVGRSARDSSELPPSVLVAQLRDYLAAGWGETLPQQSTTVHPLQPFSRRYFEPDSGLHTWAREWRPLHEPDSFRVNEASLVLSTTQAPAQTQTQTQTPIQTPALTLPQFGAFLTDPLRQFFRSRFGLDWEALSSSDPMRHDDEPFEADEEEHWLLSTLWEVPALREQGDLPAALDHLQRCGLLPLGAPGRRLRATLQRQASPMLMAWQQARRQAACSAPRRRVQLDEPLRLHDWIDGLLRPHQGAAESDVSLELCPWTALGRRTSAKSAPSAAARLRPKALIRPWLRGLLAVAEGGPALTAVVIARDARLYCRSPEPEAARHALAQLARLWREVEANALPPPLPLMTAWQWQLSRRSGAEAPEVRPVSREQVESLRRQFEGDGALGFAGERDRSPGWSRCYPDFAALLGVGPDDDLAEALPGSRFDCLSALWLDALIDWIDSGAVEVEPYEGFVAQRDHTAVALSQAGAE